MIKLSIPVLLLLITSIVGYGQQLGPGVARLPLAQIDVSMPQVTGITHFVPSGGNLQAALDAARPGDVVELQAGAVFTGRFNFYNKPDDGKWTIVRTSRHAELPYGVQVTPADSPKMAAIVPPDNLQALDLYPTFGGYTKARKWRFIGIEIRPNPAIQSNSNLIKCGANASWQTTREQAPEDIIFDRCYVHGLTNRDAYRGIILSSARTAIINSYFSEFHVVGQDSQAVLVANSPGVILIENTYLEAAGENFMSGGLDLRIPNLVPSDITFRNVYCAKPPRWNPRHPSYDGSRWSVKNLFELKMAERVLVEGCVFEHCWVDGQPGFAIQLTPRNQGGANPWARVTDVTFKNNEIRNVAAGINILGTDDLQPSGKAERIAIRGNTIKNLGDPVYGFNGRVFQLLSGASFVTIQNNSAISPYTQITAAFDGTPINNLVFTDNILSRGEGDGGIRGSGATEGAGALNLFAPGYVFLRNVIVTNNTSVRSLYPQGNYFAN